MNDKEVMETKDNFELEWIEMKEKISERRHKNEEPFMERVWAKSKANPFVPIGICATTFCLTYGLISMTRGDRRKQQLLMRGRVVAQGFTFCAIISGIMYSLADSAKRSAQPK